MKIFQNMEYSRVNPPRYFHHNNINPMISFYAWIRFNRHRMSHACFPTLIINLEDILNALLPKGRNYEMN